MKTIALVALFTVTTIAVQDPQPDAPEPQHKWLQQLVGEWKVTTEASMGPGTEPMKMESTERVRAIGDLWVLAEGTADFAGKPFTSLMTVGYDPKQKAFVGTWVDSMHAHLWTYTGSLDEAKKVLTLSAEGPAFDDPTKTAKYRDAIEIVSKDHKRLTSSMLVADGKWETFMRADYTRTK